MTDHYPRPIKLLRDTLYRSLSAGHHPDHLYVSTELWDKITRSLPDESFIAANANGHFAYRRTKVCALRTLTGPICTVMADQS